MESITIETAQQMRAKHFPCRSAQQYKGYDDYLQRLAQKGAKLNPKIYVSLFHLKNGLPFIGMAVNQVVAEGQILARIPEQLILSSAKAAQQPLLREVYQDNFFKTQERFSQDRVIIVFSLFLLHQKDETNPWFQMINRFPKQCDIACFWPESQLDQFKDKTIKSAATIDFKSFEDELEDFESLKSRHEILQFQEYSKENYKRVFTNLANRSFGKYLNFASFVPMCQLFNHHCSKVFYTTQAEKKSIYYEQLSAQKEETSSIGSCHSNQALQEGEFAYETVQITPFNEQIEQSCTLVKEQSDKIKTQVASLFQQIQTKLNWKNFSVIFAGHLIYLTKYIIKVYLIGSKSFEKTLNELNVVKSTLQNFCKRVQLYFERVNKKPYWGKKPEKKTKELDLNSPSYEKQYESLILKTSRGDRIEENNQIYFKYGFDSNRTLLLQYGFAIEGNKYQNFQVSFNISQILNDYPGVLQKVVQKKLSLLRKFRLYNHRLNIDLIIFFRLSNWQFYGQKALEQIFSVVNFEKQIAILQQIVSILQQNVGIYHGEYDLTDKSLSYHQYFTAVYHKQKLVVLHKQIKLFGLLIDILQKLSQGVSKEEATKYLTNSQKLVLSQYLHTIK